MKKKIHNLKLFRLITQVILFIFYVNIKKENTITFILSSNSIHKKRKKRHKTPKFNPNHLFKTSHYSHNIKSKLIHKNIHRNKKKE